MKAITINSMSVLDGFEIRHGTITIKFHRRWCYVDWDIGTLDKCVALSDLYLASSFNDTWYTSIVKECMTGCGKGACFTGSLRWGNARELTKEGALKIAHTINRTWAELILRWMADGSPATKRPRVPVMRAGWVEGMGWGVE